jgi:hypothetical protein
LALANNLTDRRCAAQFVGDLLCHCVDPVSALYQQRGLAPLIANLRQQPPVSKPFPRYNRHLPNIDLTSSDVKGYENAKTGMPIPRRGREPSPDSNRCTSSRFRGVLAGFRPDLTRS